MPRLRTDCSAVALYLFRGQGLEGRTLLLHRTAAPLEGTWSHVAGSIGELETAPQAALRLAREQAGLVPRLYSADICEQFYEPDGERMMLVPVFAGYVPADAAASAGEGYGEARWCSLAEAVERLAFPAQRRIVTTLWGDFVERLPSPWLVVESG